MPDGARHRHFGIARIIEDVELPRPAVVKAMNAIAQLERIDLTAAPAGEVCLELGKLGPELASVRLPGQLTQAAPDRLGLKITVSTVRFRPWAPIESVS